jgi:hypothetical protein
MQLKSKHRGYATRMIATCAHALPYHTLSISIHTSLNTDGADVVLTDSSIPHISQHAVEILSRQRYYHKRSGRHAHQTKTLSMAQYQSYVALEDMSFSAFHYSSVSKCGIAVCTAQPLSHAPPLP